MKNQNIILLLDSARGAFIPRDFITDGLNNVDEKHCSNWHINTDDALLLALGTDLEWYWETWERVLNDAYFIADDGRKFTLHHDGDLWAICYESMTDEEKQNFGFEE